MRLSNAHIIVLAVLCSTFVIAGVFFMVTKKAEESKEGQEETVKAPQFTLPDASGTLHALGDIDAEVRIINFWASWSPYSKDELNALSRIREEFGSKVHVIALNRDMHTGEGKSFLEREGIAGDILFVFDKEDEYFKKVEGYAVPETIFLGKDDSILFRKRGPITYEEVRDVVQKLTTHD